MSDSTTPPSAAIPASRSRDRAGADTLSRAGARVLRAVAAIPPELFALLVLAGVLNLWALDQNGWANDYYAAAVRSMSTSWHDFLYASMDSSGVMTVDKPPLALWVQALSVRVFGFNSLAILVPQALMGMASVALVYDLVRRRFGRFAGLAGGAALALTPIAVAMSRHNNPDALLVLCSVGALWCFVRWLDDPRMRWLVCSGVAVGLGFETKMAAALLIVPGIVAAALWVAPRGRLSALRQTLAGGLALVVVGGAWPLLMWLTPAADRPWVSGTSDNSIWSLITGYNGLGRVDGQAGGPAGAGPAGAGGGPGGGGGGFFGGSPGPLRLLNEALGGQAGWLLGFALVGGIGILVGSRLRRSDARTGWLIAVGGAFLAIAAVFSHAQGIFHPYYTSELAPFAAALVGATVGTLLRGGRTAMVLAPFAIGAGLIAELVVLGNEPGTLTWLEPVLVLVCVLTGIVLAGVAMPARARAVVVAAVLAVLLIAPAAWSFQTLDHPTSSTFPAGGPESQAGLGGPGGGPGGGMRQGAPPRAGRGFGGPPGANFAAPGGAAPPGPPQGFSGGPGAGGAAGMFGAGGEQLSSVLSYVNAHGGGMIAVSSQSTAAASIIASGAKVAGIGGFSGRESDVSASWLAQEVSSGHIRWVVDDGGTGGPGGMSDGRTGTTKAMAAVAKACTAVTLSTSGSTTTNGRTSGSSGTTLYDCQGKAAAIRAAGSGS